MSQRITWYIDNPEPSDIAVRYVDDPANDQWLVDLIYVRGQPRWVPMNAADRISFRRGRGMAVFHERYDDGAFISVYDELPAGCYGMQDRHRVDSGPAWLEYLVDAGSKARPVLVEQSSLLGVALELCPTSHAPSPEWGNPYVRESARHLKAYLDGNLDDALQVTP